MDDYEQTDFVPFDPVRKRTEATVTCPDGKIVKYSKGAPQVIIDLCSMSDEEKRRAEKTIEEFAGRGFRTLGVAKSDVDTKKWTFLGIIPMFDPPRDDSAKTIQEAIEHGLRV